ncbi:MAG: S9 family peptidase [Cytophagales bacterium]|nr:MAG: S9 family peptidase [Cytophagales bacterium]TAF60111.1 MAG: S9 family peptidase [Cytophagales bacterium]
MTKETVLKKYALRAWLFTLLFQATSLLYAQQGAKFITLEDIYQRGTFYENGVENLNWMVNSQFYSAQEGDKIKQYAINKEDAQTTLFDAGKAGLKVDFSAYEFSQDEQKILLQTAVTPIYRRSFKAQYYVFDIKTQKLTALSSNGPQSYATFSPDGTHIAFVRDNNLFVTELNTMTEKAITTNGKFNELINGSTDWVYEEEFSYAKAFWWSPDSKKIAYQIFNEKDVPEYNMQIWNAKMLYPKDYKFKYPKAGERNATVKVAVFHLSNSQNVEIQLRTDSELYLPRVQWTNDSNLLSVKEMNRLQNTLTIYHANATTGVTTEVLKEEEKAYIDLDYTDDLYYLKDGQHFLCMSERSGYNHLYLHDMNGKLVRAITTGNWEVTELLGINENLKQAQIYFISTEVSPLERHFYSIGLDGKQKTKKSTLKGTNTVDMSKDYNYYVLTHNNTTTPASTRLYQTSNDKQLKIMLQNDDVKNICEAYNFVPKELFDFKASDGTQLYGYMYKPKNIKPDTKLPVLMYVYGGPGSQEVRDEWGGGPNDFWHQMLVQMGYVIICVDNRGTQGQGSAFKKSTYRQLGKYETQDQIDAAKYAATLKFVDSKRIGIWGWSYGGYMTARCLTVGSDYFKMGISVAPVSAWEYYDTIYTERFMQRPQDNPQGYKESSVLTYANMLRGNFLLVHGTGDDNVHFQNAISLQDALIAANKQFDSFYYPNRNHGIAGGNTRMHLYRMMTNYVMKNL